MLHKCITDILGFMLNKQSYIMTLCCNGCIILNYRQMLIGNRKILLTSRRSWHLFWVCSTPRPSSDFHSNSCLFYRNWSNKWVQKLRLHQDNSAHRQLKVQVNIYLSGDGWRLLQRVSLLTISYSEVANSIMMLLVFFSPSPDDSSSRGGAGTANGDSEHAPELAGKLGNHPLNSSLHACKHFEMRRKPRGDTLESRECNT